MCMNGFSLFTKIPCCTPSKGSSQRLPGFSQFQFACCTTCSETGTSWKRSCVNLFNETLQYDIVLQNQVGYRSYWLTSQYDLQPHVILQYNRSRLFEKLAGTRSGPTNQLFSHTCPHVAPYLKTDKHIVSYQQRSSRCWFSLSSMMNMTVPSMQT
jgi:hypothetical protein